MVNSVPAVTEASLNAELAMVSAAAVAGAADPPAAVADDTVVELEPLESLLLQAVAVNASNTAPPTITRNLF
jgi:hypothetical protein